MVDISTENPQNMVPERSEGKLSGPWIEVEPGTWVGRFLRHCVFDPQTGCWLWNAKFSHHRTPSFQCFGREISARKIAWELFVGDAPGPGRIYPRCGNDRCVSPKHLKTTWKELKPHKRGVFRKLDADAIFEIRNSKESKSRLAKKFDVTEWTIWAVRRGLRGRLVAQLPYGAPDLPRNIKKADFVRDTVALIKDLNNDKQVA